MNNYTNESIGVLFTRIRKEKGLTQEEVCQLWPREKGSEVPAINRTVYAKYESGKLIPSDERIEQFASIFGLNAIQLNQMYQKAAIVIPDTSALLNKADILDLLAEDFDQIVIPTTVLLELSGMKNATGDLSDEEKIKKKKAHQMSNKIIDMTEKCGDKEKYEKRDKRKIIREDSETIPISGDSSVSLKDRKIIALAEKMQKVSARQVYILHYDKDIPLFSNICSNKAVKCLILKDYLLQRSGFPKEYQTILDFDEEFDNISRYDVAFRGFNQGDIDTFLTNGMTLLISCINCNTPEMVNKRGGRYIPERLIKEKLHFLIDHSADINKTDANRYYHTPLEHCISLNQRECPYALTLFKMLLEAGADYNKGSIDETINSFKRISEKNEGNTPLLIACWLGKRKFVYELLKYPDLSMNQQDCNGYTALIKCAVQRHDRIKNGKPYDYYEELYKLLLDKTDTKIRDRNNRTAEDWWKMGDDLLKAREIDD